MNLQAEKLNVLQHIINSEDVNLIRDIKALISHKDMDWFENLTKYQQNDVEEGIKQLDAGDHFSHDEAKRKFGYK